MSTTRTKLDLLIRGADVVLPNAVERLDIGVHDGRIVALEPAISEDTDQILDATGLVVFPGIVDAHVHFNEPGRADWEGLDSGSAALAAGGGTAFFDMPLNSTPPVLDRASFDAKRELGEAKSVLDFGIWGGLTPHNLDRIGELSSAGVVGLKAFLCGSGIDDFEAILDRPTLRRGMREAARYGLLIAVHAEDDDLARARAAAVAENGRHDAKAWLESRPVQVELAAIDRAIEVAGETGCRLHIVHVSSLQGLERIARARQNDVDVSAETCPHYLLLNDRDVERVGAAGKCAPPIRDEANRLGLWKALDAGQVQTIGSDHSPAPPEMKTGDDFFAIWGGISGCQHGFPLLLSEALRRAPATDRDTTLVRFGKLLAANVADRFRIANRKGRIQVGLDADFALLGLDDPHHLANTELLYRHRQGPYAERAASVRVIRTLLRGAPPERGQFLKPS